MFTGDAWIALKLDSDKEEEKAIKESWRVWEDWILHRSQFEMTPDVSFASPN